MSNMLKVKTLFTIFTTLLLSGCDPETALNEHFKKQGLNRLAYVRDDIEPGGLILVSRERAIYADSMFDYVNISTENAYPITAEDKTVEYNAILKSFTSDRTVEPSVALSFVEAVLPLSFEGKLKLTDKVTISMANAKVRRMKIPTVQSFLGRQESAPFRQFVSTQLNEAGNKAFVIYEAFRTNKLKMTTDGGKDITTSVDVGKPVSIVSKAGAKFQYKRTTKSELEITGDHFYVFAVRTGQLTTTANGGLTFVPGNFKLPGNPMGGTSEEKFTQPVMTGFEKLSLGNILDSPAGNRTF